jgi:RHS repeat-associated protein
MGNNARRGTEGIHLFEWQAGRGAQDGGKLMNAPTSFLPKAAENQGRNMKKNFRHALAFVAYFAVLVLGTIGLAQSAPPTLITPKLPNALAGVIYEARLTLGTTSNITNVTAGGLPAGLSLAFNASGAVTIQGNTNAGGSFAVALSATNADGVANHALQLAVDDYSSKVTAVSSGGSHACALVDGGVECWGANNRGQLGIYTNTPPNYASDQNSRYAIAIPRGSGVTAISAGRDGNCAILNGGVKCWGYVGLTSNFSTAYDLVAPGSDATAVAVDAFYGCAVVSGGVQCWGDNSYGQHGRASPTFSNSLVSVIAAGAGVTAIATSRDHVCAVMNGGVSCWGTGDRFQLDGKTSANSFTPVVAIPAGSGATAVAADDASCAVVAGGVRCWGTNTSFALGVADTTARIGDPIPAGSDVTAISHAADCAVIAQGLKCWGPNGTSSSNSPNRPVPEGGSQLKTPVTVFASGSGVVSVSSHQSVTCVAKSGRAGCWGESFSVGAQRPTFADYPATAIPAGSGVTAVSAGGSVTCSVIGGGIFCNGANYRGAFGNGEIDTSSLRPLPASGLGSGATAISLSASYVPRACAVISGGLRCWGDSPSFTTDANSPPILTPTAFVAAGSQVSQVDVGNSHQCFVANGGVKCWGSNNINELGNGSTAPSATPVNAIAAGGGATATSTADGSCAIVSGGLKCWGLHPFFDFVNRPSTPTTVFPANSGVASVSGNCVVANGGLRCWVANSSQALVLTTIFPENSGVTFVSSRNDRTCAVVLGGLSCWGRNDKGQLGLGTVTSLPITTPTVVIPANSGITSVAIGYEHTCVVANGGEVCWGDNLYGQVGDPATYGGRTTFVAIPKNILAPTAPTLRSSSAGVGSVTILFDRASPLSSAYPITGYTATCTAPGQISQTGTAPENATSITVTGLSRGVTYTCSVAANSYGASGPSSATVNATGITSNTPNDLNADGKTDLLLRQIDGRAAVRLMNGTTVSATAEFLPAGSGLKVTHIADLNADGKADLVLQHTDGSIQVFLMDGTTVSSRTTISAASAGWRVMHAADLNADGKADLVLSHIDGRIALWLMNGTTVSSQTSILGAGSGWQVAHTGDLNGDGKADLIMQHTDGSIAGYLMNGAAVTNSTVLIPATSGWRVTQVGDLNADGKADLVLAHTDGRIRAWLMDGLAIQAGSFSFRSGGSSQQCAVSIPTTPGSGFILDSGSGWRITATADLNGDNKADLILKHTDGRIDAMLMDGLNTVARGNLLPEGSTVNITQTGNFNGDSKADLVLTGLDGSIQLLLMNGVSIITSANVQEADTGWAITPPTPAASLTASATVTASVPAGAYATLDAVNVNLTLDTPTDTAIARLELYADGVLVAVINGDGSTNSAASLLKGIISGGNLPFFTAAGGSYVLTVRTVDTFGNAAFSAPVTVNVAANPNEEITFLHEDLAGNTIAATDARGVVKWKENYSPFGERAVNGTAATANNRQWFAGKPQDTESGLSYFGARYYDPAIGRFMGIDPVGFQDGNVHSFNRYAYGNNNPYKYRDPDGRFAIPIARALLVVGAIVVATSATPEQKQRLAEALSGGMRGASDRLREILGDGVTISMGPEKPKVVTVPADKYPESAEHIEDAQNAGQPTVLTVDRGGAKDRRKAALAGTAPVADSDRDEYPPAMFGEGGSGASVRPIKPSDNRGAGACIGAQCRGLADGTQVEIKVVK